jgi:hypothetical protein
MEFDSADHAIPHHPIYTSPLEIVAQPLPNSHLT